MDSYYRNNYRGYGNNYSVGDIKKRINNNQNRISQNYHLNNLNYSNANMNYNLHTQSRKNIAEMTKLNYITENQNTNTNFIQTNPEIIKLDHKLIESTTEDNDHPLRELLKGLKGVGWFSSRFSQFPQEIYIQFSQPVVLRQINMVIHEKNIPAQIKFYSYFPENINEIIDNYHNAHYKYIGFIKMDTNERSQFRARESRKVYVNTKSLFLKIELGKNYINEYNVFNQVGLMNLDFFGSYLPPLGNDLKKNKFILKHAAKKDINNNISDQALEDICGPELKDLKEKMNFNIKIENYQECKQIKMKLDKVRIYGKQIYDLENQKKMAVNNEDFDQAMDLKNLVDKMKANLKTVMNSNVNNNFIDLENQIVGNTKYSQLGQNKNPINNLTTINNNQNNNDSLFNNNNNTNSNIFNITNEINNNQNINESIYTNSNDMNNQLNQSGTKYLLNTHQKEKINEDNFISYDDTILPAVLKKLTNEPKNTEDEIGDVDKGELEQISPSLLKEFKLIADVIGELGMRKLFSKQILWKEEGLAEFIDRISDILDYKVNGSKSSNNSDITNTIITSIMKLSMLLIEEKHPSVIIKTLEILKQLFEYIKLHGTKLNIDLNITDSVLTKIKRKLGDANKKVRSKAVSLYCYMLTLDFCDYNNLISELLEEELKHYDSKYVQKSPNLIMGKLEIFNSVFDQFEDAVNSKRTSLESFPSNLVMEYLILNVSNNKSEVRKLCRAIISKFIRIFGVNKIKKKLEKIEERELLKLINEIPALEPYFPKINKANLGNNSLSQLNGSNASNNSKRKTISKNKDKNIRKIGERKKGKHNTKREKSAGVESNTLNNTKTKIEDFENGKNKENEETNRNKERQSTKNKIKNKSYDFCDYCQRKMGKDEVLANHWVTDCPMFIRCEKCNMNTEIQNLTHHKLSECKFKNDFKECRTCHEAFPSEEYNNHLRNKCGLKRGYIKCPLCHNDIQDNNKGFFQHLVKNGCPLNKK